MYTPVQFQERRREILVEAVRDIQLATLVTATPEGYQASHVPMVLKTSEDMMVLETHVALANTHWTVVKTFPVVSLAVFQGPQAYVSPSWYASKREHGRVVPTWNYIAVHAHGRLEVAEGEEWLLAHLHELTSANENNREHPWTLSDAPAGYIRNLAKSIVGLRMRVDRMEGSWKMIQHRADGDRDGTIAGLSASPCSADHEVAEIMRRLEKQRASVKET